MITALTSSSLTADQILTDHELHDALYLTSKHNKAIYLHLVINVYGAHVVLAALAGLIGKPAMEAAGWSIPEFNETNFVKIMAAGSATLSLATIFGMNALSLRVQDRAITQNTATFAMGLPFNTIMGACYALAGAGMQHLLKNNEELAFTAAAGATGNAIAYLALALATRARACTIPAIARNNFMSVRTCIPPILLGHNFSNSDAMALSTSRNFGSVSKSEAIQLLMIFYAINLLMAAAGGALGYWVLDNSKWKNPDFNKPEFVETMLAGAAILCLLTTLSMIYTSEQLINKNKISQNVVTFGIGTLIHAVMGAIYGLSGCVMQNKLKNTNDIAFVASAGAVGNSITYLATALLMDGHNALIRARTQAADQSQDNCFLSMYKRNCIKNKQSVDVTNDDVENVLRTPLLTNG